MGSVFAADTAFFDLAESDFLAASTVFFAELALFLVLTLCASTLISASSLPTLSVVVFFTVDYLLRADFLSVEFTKWASSFWSSVAFLFLLSAMISLRAALAFDLFAELESLLALSFWTMSEVLTMSNFVFERNW